MAIMPPCPRKSRVDVAGAHEFVTNMIAYLDAQPDRPFRWTAPGLLAYLLRKESGVDEEKSRHLADMLIKKQVRSVTNVTGLDAETLADLVDQATSEVLCAWNEKARLRIKPGKTEEKLDDHGRVIMKALVKNGKPVLDKAGEPRFVPETEILSWVHEVIKEPLSWLDQARKVMGTNPRMTYGFGLSELTVANMVRAIVGEVPKRLERAEKQVKLRAKRRENLAKARIALNAKHDRATTIREKIAGDHEIQRMLDHSHPTHSTRVRTIRGSRNAA